MEVPAQPPSALLGLPDGEGSAPVRARVAAARERQQARQGAANGQLDAATVAARTPLAPAAQSFLLKAAERLGWSGRALHRVLKVARTIADLQAADSVDVAHVAEAVQYRRALPG